MHLPINPVKDENGEDLIIFVKFPKRRLYLKVWKINVGRIKLYLMDSDIEKNNAEDRDITATIIWWRPRNENKTRNSSWNGRS